MNEFRDQEISRTTLSSVFSPLAEACNPTQIVGSHRDSTSFQSRLRLALVGEGRIWRVTCTLHAARCTRRGNGGGDSVEKGAGGGGAAPEQ